MLKKYIILFSILLICVFSYYIFVPKSYKLHKISDGVKISLQTEKPAYTKNETFIVKLNIQNINLSPVVTKVSNCSFVSPHLTFDKNIKEFYFIERLNSKEHSEFYSGCMPSMSQVRIFPGQRVSLQLKFTPKKGKELPKDVSKLHITSHFNNTVLPMNISILNN